MVHKPGLQGRKGVQGDRVHGPVRVMVHCKVFTKVDFVQVERTCHVMVSKVVHGPGAQHGNSGPWTRCRGLVRYSPGFSKTQAGKHAHSALTVSDVVWDWEVKCTCNVERKEKKKGEIAEKM